MVSFTSVWIYKGLIGGRKLLGHEYGRNDNVGIDSEGYVPQQPTGDPVSCYGPTAFLSAQYILLRTLSSVYFRRDVLPSNKFSFS
jgi:hypothetical protein